MKPLWISTTLWGAWHVAAFLKFCLPSLKAAGNLPDADCKIVIHTKRSDADQLIPHLPRGAEVWRDVPENAHSELGYSADMQGARWKADLLRAREARALIAFLPPDIAWGQGTLARYVELFTAGAGLLYHHLPRVNLDTAAGELEGVTDRRALAGIALRHEHHLGYRFRIDSPDYPTHTENVSVGVPGGVLTRLLAGAPLAMDPSRCGFNHLAMPDRDMGDGLAVIADSDEAIGLSLAQGTKDLNWMRSGRKISIPHIRAWLGQYTTPVSPALARHSYRLHATDGVQWSDAEARMDRLMDEVFGARAIAA